METARAKVSTGDTEKTRQVEWNRRNNVAAQTKDEKEKRDAAVVLIE